MGFFCEERRVVKLLAIAFVIAAGLPLGREGPMVYLGAAVGALVFNTPALRRLVTTVQRSNIRGVALLDYLHASAASCVHSMRAAFCCCYGQMSATWRAKGPR